MDSEGFLCNECLDRVERIRPPICKRCGLGVNGCTCNRRSNLTAGHVFDCAISPFFYEGAIKNCIMYMKYGGHEEVARFLGYELSLEIAAQLFARDIDILTCVPSTRKSLSKRGFNQSQSIAENLNLSDLGFSGYYEDYSLLLKSNDTAIQHKLNAQARRENIKNAYSLSKNRNVEGKRILLVDDIMTTGATGDSCAKALKFAGASKVYLATASAVRYIASNDCDC